MRERFLVKASWLAQPLLLLSVVCAACADEPVPGTPPPPPAECPIDENSRFTFTSVMPPVGVTNSPICIDVDPELLNTQADAGAEVCQVTQKEGCRADVACQVMGVDIIGEMAALEDGIFGDFDVFVPGLGKVCSYTVEATLKQ